MYKKKPSYAKRVILTKTWTIVLLANTTLNHIGFGFTAGEQFHFRDRNETEDTAGLPKQSCGS